MAKISGVYKLQSKAMPERVYIGSSVDVRSRIWYHFSGMLHGYSNTKMIKHFIEFGREDFEVTIIEECPQNILREREQYYIDLYCPYFNNTKANRLDSQEILKNESRSELHKQLLSIRKRLHKEHLEKQLTKLK